MIGIIELIGPLGLTIAGVTVFVGGWIFGEGRAREAFRGGDLARIGLEIEDELKKRCAHILHRGTSKRYLYQGELTRWQNALEVVKSEEGKQKALDMMTYWSTKIESILDAQERHLTEEQQEKLERVVSSAVDTMKAHGEERFYSDCMELA